MRGCKSLNDSEIQNALSCFSGKFATRARALAVLGIRTGLRISELLSLTVGDVLAGGDVVDRVYIERRNVKGKREGRSIALHPEARDALRAWILAMGSVPLESPLFPSQKKGGPLGRIAAWKVLRRTFRRAGINGKVGTHTMRKTFARRIYNALGHDLIRTGMALGHKSISSTIAYLSFAEEDIDAAVLAM